MEPFHNRKFFLYGTDKRMGRTEKLRCADNHTQRIGANSERSDTPPPGALKRYQADFAIPASINRGKQSEHYQQGFMDETANAAKAHTVIPAHLSNYSVNSRWI